MTRFTHLRRPVLFLIALSSLACASHGAAQDSARALLERGAFAEEHERDFDAATELYAKAAETAHAAKDSATESEATAARNRVLARQGKAPAQPPPTSSELPAQARRLLIEGSRLDAKSDAAKANVKDLAIVGASVVPALETMFAAEGTFLVDGFGVEPNPLFAVQALAAIDAPEAHAALVRCMESPDPLIRYEIVKVASSSRDRALLERGAHDDVQSVYNAAISRLCEVRDAALVNLMEPAARRGNFSACKWLTDVAIDRALTLAEDHGVTANVRVYLLKRLDSGQLTASVDLAKRLLALGRDAEPEVAAQAQELLARAAKHWQPSLGTLRESIGASIAAEVERAPTAALVQALGSVGSSHLPRALLALVHKLGDRIADPELTTAIGNAVSMASHVATPTEFDAWMEFALAVPPTWIDPSGGRVQVSASNLLGNLAQGAPADVLVRRARNLPASFQPFYSTALRNRVMSERGLASQTGKLDPAALPLAAAWYAIDREGAANEYAQVIAATGDVEQLPSALDLLRDAGSSGPESACQQLISSAPQRAAEILAQRLTKLASAPSADRSEWRVCQALGWLPDEAALALFRELWPKLSSNDARQTPLYVLVGSISGPAATNEVVARYHDIAADQPITRQAAVARFGRELCEPAIPLLGEALKDSSESVRAAARKASESFKEQRQALEEFSAWTNASKEARDSVAELTKLLESSNRDVVLGAVKALSAVKAKTALPALVKLLEKNDPELKKAVQDAIAKIGE